MVQLAVILMLGRISALQRLNGELGEFVFPPILTRAVSGSCRSDDGDITDFNVQCRSVSLTLILGHGLHPLLGLGRLVDLESTTGRTILRPPLVERYHLGGASFDNGEDVIGPACQCRSLLALVRIAIVDGLNATLDVVDQQFGNIWSDADAAETCAH